MGQNPVPCNVIGNEQANTLANQGRANNPLYPAKNTPHGRQLHPSCTPARTDKRPKVGTPGDSPIRPLVLNFNDPPNILCITRRRLRLNRTPF